MLIFLASALAAPCTFTGLTEETETVPGLEYAWDNNTETWMEGTNFNLGLTLAEDQLVEQVGVLVQSEDGFAFDLEIWYLPTSGTKDEELFSTTGSLPAGTNRGAWDAGVAADELLYSFNTNSTQPLGFQVVCESSVQSSNFQGGGGCACDSREFGLEQSSATTFLSLLALILRRRKP